MEDEYYLKGYDDVLGRCDELYEILENKKDKMSDRQYIEFKYAIDMQRYTTLGQKENAKSIYGSMTSMEREEYYNADRMIEGEFTNYDVDDDNISYASRFNNFFKTKEGKINDNREIEVKESFYNDIIKYCDDAGINLSDYNIYKDSNNNRFSIPHNTKSFMKFAEIYSDVLSTRVAGGAFIDTANEMRITSDYSENMAGDILDEFGMAVKKAKGTKTRIERKYGLHEYYIPILQQFTDDITVETMRRAGYKDVDINNQYELCLNTLKALDPGSVEVYASDETIEHGGRNPLTLVTDSKVKQNIFNDIFRGIGENTLAEKAQKGKIQMSFCTMGDKSGTSVLIPKSNIDEKNPYTNNSYYQVFIPDALPSRLKEEFDNNPTWKYPAIVNTWDAQANPNVAHYVNIGGAFDGTFHGYGNGGFIYKKDNKIINDRVSKDEVAEICYGSDMLRRLAITRHSVPENNLVDFDAEAMGVIAGGLAQSISNITNTPIELVVKDLQNYYYKYYSK